MSDSQPLMAGKRGIVRGVANDRSIAWGIARVLAAHGAEIAFSYQAPQLERRVRPLAESVGSSVLIECDAGDDESLDRMFS
ncbi:MAG: SDR family oxidoreductase, partial [Pseudomonadota bacterium]